MADWVELRVHGVSGTPPEAMLGSAHVVQVAGDDRSRSFRPTDAQGNEIRAADGHVVEAFHWGRWTSGSWTQALWMLLIPFGIVNAAQFMLPAPTGPWSRAAHTISGAVLRILALVLTVLLEIGACVILLDLVVWQWVLRRSFPVDDRIVLIVGLVGTALIGVALGLLGRSKRGPLARFTHARPAQNDETALPDLRDDEFFDGDPDSPALRNLHRAAGLAIVAQLGMSVAAESRAAWAGWIRWAPLVILVAVATVVLLLGDPERTTTVTRDGRTGWLLSTLRAIRTWWHGRPPSPTSTGTPGASAFVATLLLAAAAWALVLSLLAVGTAEMDRARGLAPARGTLPGIDGTAAVVGIAGTVTVLALLLAVFMLAVSTRGAAEPIKAFRRFAGGMTAALAASVGFFLGIGLTAGFSLFVQGLLNRLRTEYPEELLRLLPDDAPERLPAVKAPPVLQRVSYSWGITTALIVLLVLAVLAWVGLRRATFRIRAARAMTFGAEAQPRLPSSWLSRVASAMQTARLKNLLVPTFWYFGLAGAVLASVATVAYLRNRDLTCRPEARPDDRCVEFLTGVSSLPGAPVTADDVVIGIGSFVLVALGTALVTVARGALRAEGPRRVLSVIWDVLAFWPRSVHPFVPAPYSQMVVPALVRRVCWHLGVPDPFVPDSSAPASTNPRKADMVVVAAHSQGSLIALAALFWLPREARPKVRWLTFGSQLRQQFPRAFPHYVTVEMLRHALVRYGWQNLYRDTDPIAGPVTSWCHSWDAGPYESCRLEGPDEPLRDTVDPTTGRRECGREWRLLDPVPADRGLQRGTAAAILGHSDYWRGPDYADALLTVRSRTVPPEPDPEPAPDPVSPEPAAPPAGG